MPQELGQTGLTCMKVIAWGEVDTGISCAQELSHSRRSVAYASAVNTCRLTSV
jgi:hypothetical protein